MSPSLVPDAYDLQHGMKLDNSSAVFAGLNLLWFIQEREYMELRPIHRLVRYSVIATKALLPRGRTHIPISLLKLPTNIPLPHRITFM